MILGGGQFVPAEGSVCDTRLMIENHSQAAQHLPDQGFVKKITGCLTQDATRGRVFFVKKFASPEKARKSGTFRPKRGATGVTGRVKLGGRKPTFPTGYRLARMLRPQTVTMYADSSSMMPWGRTTMAPPRQLVDMSRDLSEVPGFFVLFFCVKIFTNRWVPTLARSGAERKDQYAELCDPGQM